jgi:DNA-binding transcriptional LysR family regulator
MRYLQGNPISRSLPVFSIVISSKKFPETDLHVDICNSHQIEMMLKNNECDFAIMDEREDPSLSGTKLYAEVLKPVAAKKYCAKERLKESELLSYRLLLREQGSGNRNCIEPYLKNISFPESSIWSACSDEVLLNMAGEGKGIAFLPASYLAEHQSSKIHEIQIAGWKLQRIFYLVTRKDRYLNHAVQQCMKYIADAL